MNDKYALPEPSFDSALVATLFEIERMRANIGTGSTPVETFDELHGLFSIVMSVVSARIEGNHTTIFEAIDGAETPRAGTSGEHLREITNITDAADFIDSLNPNSVLTHATIRELHERAVVGLTREGDPTPGKYREQEVRITGSDHVPPSHVTLHAEMSELLKFANADFPMSHQILQIAVAHHRFVWIHPFLNGNGRVSRLFTHAMLRRTVFSSGGHSALNPTSVFGNDRGEYIAALERADSLSRQGTMEWAEFFATGIRDDLARLMKLQKLDYVTTELLRPTFNQLAAEGIVSTETASLLLFVAGRGAVKAGDLTDYLPGSPAQRSRSIRTLTDQGLLRTASSGPRFYKTSLAQGPIASRLIRRLDDLGFLPKMLSGD